MNSLLSHLFKTEKESAGKSTLIAWKNLKSNRLLPKLNILLLSTEF